MRRPGPATATLETMLLAVIAAGEVGFWVLLGTGLVARYLLRMRRTSTVLLLATPMIDLVILFATVIDLRRGATANFTHGLAAAYIGFSIAFGRDMIRWADQRFAHRFAGGPEPWRPPKRGWARVRYEWRGWGQGVIGWAVACALLGGAVLWVDDPARTGELMGWMARLSSVMVIWLVFWPVWWTISAAFGQSDYGEDREGDRIAPLRRTRGAGVDRAPGPEDRTGLRAGPGESGGDQPG